MTDTQHPGGTTDAADAELGDAMDSIRSTGEDWRSRERAMENDQNAPDTHDAPADDTDEETDNG